MSRNRTIGARFDFGFRIPHKIIDALEEAAQRAGRTWNEQVVYAIEVCRGAKSVAPDDERTANDWRALMAEMTMCLDGKDWIPVGILYPPLSKDVPH